MKIRHVLVAASAALWASLSIAAEIFPKPLHITRVIEDPIARSRTTVDEYLVGDVMISTTGARTAIFDYQSSRITIIDRTAGTYSISTFEEFAASRPMLPASAAAKRQTKDSWTIETKATEQRAGRESDVREAKEKNSQSPRTVRVTTDRAISLNTEGFEVLTGSRYPLSGDELTEVVREVARRDATATSKAASSFSLPLMTVVTYRDGSEEIKLVNEVTRVVEEAPNALLTEIPRGARKVDSPFVSIDRKLKEIDTLPGSKQ
jgi:hypothetical protein